MQIRLMGTADECAEMVTVLRGCRDLDQVEVSAPFPSRDDSTRVRVYVRARLVQLEEVQR